MSKVFTAQDMREFANYNDAAYARNPGLYSSAVSAALRQAADLIEREKKYEYAAKYLSIDVEKNVISRTHYESSTQVIDTAVKVHGIRHVVLRREVGEWEEVRDGK